MCSARPPMRRLPTADAERRRQAQTQLDALEAFWSEWFRSEKGEFKAAFQTFPNTDAFEQQIELLLRQWLETRGLLGPRIAWPKEKGSPFRGLAPFEAEHAAVFFGRDRVIDEARRRLVGAAERGSPFLLIVGASGSGKSSLARAGLIPRLTTPGVVASVDLWRVARMKPGEGQAGPLMALATALLAADALPELAQGDYPTAASLADNLRRGGTASVQPITSALARVAEDAQRERHADQAPKPALVLLVDQFEELFAQRVSDAERAAFAESLRQLVATGRVWVRGNTARRPLRASAEAASVESPEGDRRQPRPRPARTSRARRDRARASRGGRAGVRDGSRERRAWRAAARRCQDRRQPAAAAVHAAAAL